MRKKKKRIQHKSLVLQPVEKTSGQADPESHCKTVVFLLETRLY